MTLSEKLWTFVGSLLVFLFVGFCVLFLLDLVFSSEISLGRVTVVERVYKPSNLSTGWGTGTNSKGQTVSVSTTLLLGRATPETSTP